MARGFEINEEGMREFESALQKRFSQMNISVPVGAELGSGNVFITGDRSQVVMGDNRGILSQGATPVAADYEPLALAIQELLELLHTQDPPSDADREALAGAERAVLGELSAEEPDSGTLNGGLLSLRGLATPFLTTFITSGAHEAAIKLADLLDQLHLPG